MSAFQIIHIFRRRKLKTMKQLLILCALLLLCNFSFGQCPLPTISSWHFSDSANVEIAFMNNGANGEYEFVFTALYRNSNSSFLNVSETSAGASADGLNVIEFNTLELLTAAQVSHSLPDMSLDAARYYYQVELRTTCQEDVWSDYTKFYVSPFSMLNDPDFSCNDSLYMPIQYLSDGAGFVVSVDIEIPEQAEIMGVEHLALFVDIGHTYNGDIRIDLTSPSGMTQTVFDPTPFFLGNSSGLSVYFSDDGEATEIEEFEGNLAPFEPFANFNGEVASGIWTVTIADVLGADIGFVFGVCLELSSEACTATLEGNTYLDMNANGSNDLDENGFPFTIIENTLSQSSFFTNSEGDYLRCVEAGSGVLSVLNPPLYYEANPESHAIDIIEGDALINIDFAITPIPGINDLSVTIFNWAVDRPGFENTYFIQYQNLGTTCIDDVEIEITLDPLLEFVDCNADNYSVNDNVITVNLGTLCPMEMGSFELNHYLSDTVSIGTILNTSVVIFPIEGDENFHDNTAELASIVVGSYDPNDKQVSDATINADFVLSQQRLNYFIRFQNTGTFFAENVVVTDTLDASLDMSTFQLLDKSHDVNITVDGSVLYFNFNNIMLPDSAADYDGSNGYFQYSIAPYDNLANGTLIENTAYIYFDFNEAIITNTVETLVDFASGVNSIAFAAQLAPNPTTDVLSIAWSQEVSLDGLIVYDVLGKQMMQIQLDESHTMKQLDVSQLQSGHYIIHFRGKGLMKPVKFVKM